MDLSVSSSSWGLGRAAVCDCGSPWTFLLPFFGNRQPDKNRPHKVIMKNRHLRKDKIDNAKHISSKAPPMYKKVVIVKDLTPRQREETKKKKKKKKKKEENDKKSKG